VLHLPLALAIASTTQHTYTLPHGTGVDFRQKTLSLWNVYFENEFCFEVAGANRARTRRRKSPAPKRTLPTKTNEPDSDKDPKKVIDASRVVE